MLCMCMSFCRGMQDNPAPDAAALVRMDYNLAIDNFGPIVASLAAEQEDVAAVTDFVEQVSVLCLGFALYTMLNFEA